MNWERFFRKRFIDPLVELGIIPQGGRRRLEQGFLKTLKKFINDKGFKEIKRKKKTYEKMTMQKLTEIESEWRKAYFTGRVLHKI